MSRQNTEYVTLIFNDINFIVTLPNADEGNELIFQKLSKLDQQKSNFFIYKSLGQKKYLSCLKFVDGVIGNSSSGIMEVPSFKKGTITYPFKCKKLSKKDN